MKNKGYTLIELLGVMIILSLLIAIVFPSIINFIKKSNDKIDSITDDLIISAAEDYINDNSSNFYLSSGIEYCISVDTLIDNQYLKEAMINNDLYFSKSVKVTYKDKPNYEIINNEDCSVCKLVSGNYNEIGSKYQCKVKDNMESGFEDGYYFHLLSINDDNTINLIMDRNIHYDKTNDVGMASTLANPGHIEWINQKDYENAGGIQWEEKVDTHVFGPITAMNYIHNSTKDWDNVLNVIVDYSEDNYGQVKTTNSLTQILNNNNEAVKVNETEYGYLNLKARMPYFDEIEKAGCAYRVDESCPTWLMGYLRDDGLEKYSSLTHISEIFAYWTFEVFYTNVAWVVHYESYFNAFTVINSKGGVRPVITVKNVIELN